MVAERVQLTDHPTYQLTFTDLPDAETAANIQHFIDYLTNSTEVLSRLNVLSMTHDPQAGTITVVLEGSNELIQRLYFHMQTYYQAYHPTLTEIAPVGEDAERKPPMPQ